MAKKKYCNRCAHEMWYDETAKRWYCTNPKCVKYKQPKEEPVEEVVEQPKQEETPVEQPTQETTAADTNVGDK